MNILVACEESQAVTIELRKKGHKAFSCDILPESGGHPEWHIQQDVLPLLDGNCSFITNNVCYTTLHGRWDMIIAFPPCTHLAVSGARHFEQKRADGRQRNAIFFFEQILNADCDRIAVENPVNIIGSDYMKQWFPEFVLPNCTQYIQPYEFGSPSRKKTCLWLKNLPLLKPTEIVEPKLITYKDGSTFSYDYCHGSGDRGQRRSKTYPGIARAMAEQWTDDITNNS